MKKMIVIEEENNKNNYEKRQKLIKNGFCEWLIYMIGYALVLILVSNLFESFEITSKYFGLFAFLSAIIIYALNQTIKPILFYLTLPLTALTFGLFYPIINVLILYLTSFILGSSNFYISGFIAPFFIAIFISILNIFMEGIFIKPIIRRK